MHICLVMVRVSDKFRPRGMGRDLDRRLASSDCCMIAEIVIQYSAGMNTEYQKRRAISGAIFLSGITLVSAFSPVPVEES